MSTRLATASATQADVQRAVFHVTVARPTGEVCAAYSMNVVADDLTAQAAIPFALNDAPGIWTVRAKDVASGVTGQTTVTLK